MPASDFTDFCAMLCELVGVQPPALSADEHGVVGFTVTCDGVEIGFADGEFNGHAGVILVANFGPADEARELQVLRQLLDTNFLLSDICSPVFVRNPVTAHIALHQSWAMALVDVPDVFQALKRTAAAVKRWQQDDFVDPVGVARTPHIAWMTQQLAEKIHG